MSTEDNSKDMIERQIDITDLNLTPEQLQKLIEEEEQKRQNTFIAEYNALCAKHGYNLAPQLLLKVIKL